LGRSFDTFDRESFETALASCPWLELWIAGTSAQRELAGSWAADARVRFFEVDSRGTESHMLQAAMKAALALDYPFVGYWGPDCEVPLTILGEWVAKLESSSLQLVFGSRLRLVQNHHPGLWFRHYAGRVLASAISLMLNLQVYDTECCAKLFRNGELSRRLFATPFETSVCFDIETFQRLLECEVQDNSFRVARDCFEYVLRGWRRRSRSRYGAANVHLVVADMIRLRKRAARLDRAWS
jgi:hypothetical protein